MYQMCTDICEQTEVETLRLKLLCNHESPFENCRSDNYDKKWNHSDKEKDKILVSDDFDSTFTI